MIKRDHQNTNFYSVNITIFKSPYVKVYNVKFKTLLNKHLIWNFRNEDITNIQWLINDNITNMYTVLVY